MEVRADHTEPRRDGGTGHTLLVTEHFADEYAGRLAEAAPNIEVVRLAESNVVAAADVERLTIAFMSKDAWPSRVEAFLASVAAAPRLQWFHIMSAGVDGEIFDDLRASGTRVSRSAGASAHAIAETVFMFLHALSRDVRASAARQAERHFEWHRWRELEGRRIAVLGYGPIGARIVELALAYGMQPTVFRRRVRGDETFPTLPLSLLADVIGEHDVVVVALPLNDETRGVVSRSVIERMRRDSLFVNVARGALVDQRALAEALADNRIGGAGLDVFETEPLPADDPLWDLPNVLITPHNAGSGEDGPRLVAEIFFENLGRFLTGEPMLYEV